MRPKPGWSTRWRGQFRTTLLPVVDLLLGVDDHLGGEEIDGAHFIFDAVVVEKTPGVARCTGRHALDGGEVFVGREVGGTHDGRFTVQSEKIGDTTVSTQKRQQTSKDNWSVSRHWHSRA